MTVPTEWRSTPQLRVGTAIALAIVSVLAMSFAADSAHLDALSQVAGLAFFAFSVAFLSASGFGSYVRVAGEDIIVANVYVTYRYRLSSVRAIHSVGLSFLTLELVDGSRKGCWAVQAPNASLMRKRRTRVEDVADELRYVTKGRLGTDNDVEVRQRWSGLPMVGWFVLAVVLLPATLWAIVH